METSRTSGRDSVGNIHISSTFPGDNLSREGGVKGEIEKDEDSTSTNVMTSSTRTGSTDAGELRQRQTTVVTPTFT